MTSRGAMSIVALSLAAAHLVSGCALQQTVAPLERPWGSQAAPQVYVWFEAETPLRTNFPPAEQNPFGPHNPTEAAVLSEGRWIGAGEPRDQVLYLEYRIQVPEDGTYTLYARKFWLHGPYRWRFDQQEWQSVGGNVALLDEAPIRRHVVANWTEAGQVTLRRGPATLRVELASTQGAACFDVFLLTRTPFVPSGLRRPGQRHNRAAPGWFPFEPDADRFTESPLDLRFLNERYAGENGWIRARGENFVHERTGEVVRFWAVNAGPGVVNLSKPKIDHLARMLAKYGVNMVRLHGSVWDRNQIDRIDQEFLGKIHYFIYAMKREGIYSVLSIYFPLWIQMQDHHGFAGYGGRFPFALLYFDEKFQGFYRNWWRSLLTTPNPYTGVPLAKEPAVAVLEMINEDSTLFWTFTPYENIPEQQMPTIERAFGTWLTRKYGSIERAFAAWGGGRIRGDLPAQGRVGFASLWDVFNQRTLRHQDQAEFLTVLMKDFYTETDRFLKQDLGYEGLTVASNWITADPQRLGPLDKWANTVADVMDKHGYFDVRHEGEGAGFSLAPGHRYDDRSALRFEAAQRDQPKEFSLPIFDIQYNRMPSMISEVNWPMPNRFRADFPIVASAYGALQGTDAVHSFALAGHSWMAISSKFPIQTPVLFGQFPAAALMYRRGYITEGPTVAEANLEVSRLKALEGGPISAPVNLDQLRAADIPEGQAAPVERLEQVDPLAFLVGKVAVNFVEEPTPSHTFDLSRYIDRRASRVRSATGELLWDYAIGKVVIDSPRAQGITGFLREARTVQTRDAIFVSPMEHGSILLVSLDGLPLAESSRMLLQVMSEDQPFGWRTSAPDGFRELLSVGQAPMTVRNISGTVRLRRADAAQLRVTALDHNGYTARPAGNASAIELIPNCLYYLIER